MPASRPSGGTIAFAVGLLSKPMPGTLSKDEASAAVVPSYGVGFSDGGAAAPSDRSADRRSAESGVLAATVRTPIAIGSVHPAASYG